MTLRSIKPFRVLTAAGLSLVILGAAMSMGLALARVVAPGPPTLPGFGRILLLAAAILLAARLSDRAMDLYDRAARLPAKVAAAALAVLLAVPLGLWLLSAATVLLGAVAGVVVALVRGGWIHLSSVGIRFGLIEEMIALATALVVAFAWSIYRLRQTSRLLAGIVESILGGLLIVDAAGRLADPAPGSADLPFVGLFLGTYVVCGGLAGIERGIRRSEIAFLIHLGELILQRLRPGERRRDRPDPASFG